MDGVELTTGQVLPGTVYRALRHLATGGMGSVYEVEDVTVGKKYVLKTLHPQLVDREDLARRMQEEARTLAKLQHPNIVEVFTAGVTRTTRPVPFYVMERLRGNNLRFLLEKKGTLDLVPAYRIAIDVLDALEHAHENSIIHRDVKPENIFLHHNANGTATTKLLDFGIMRMLDRKVSLTAGKFVGTLRYASPEQIMAGRLGPPTDIYSLGVVLFEMIAGRGPFDDAGDAFAIGQAHAQKPAPPLSAFVRGLPAELERLVASALAKNPAERPRDCFTFASELRRLWREEEASPRSVTAVNPVTHVPDTRHQQGVPTEAASLPDTRLVVTPPGAAKLSAPSAVHDTSVDPSRRESAFAATALSPQAPQVARGTTPSGPSALALGIDRNAETRVSAGVGQTQRLAMNGTQMDDADRAVFALGEHAPLEIPPGGGSDEVVFPRSAAAASGTGPHAGEARTRPPDRMNVIAFGIASAVMVLVLGGAVLWAKPWTRMRTVASAGVSASASASAPAPASASASASASAPASAPASASASAPALASAGSVAFAAEISAPASAAASTSRPRPRVAPAAPPARAKATDPTSIGFEGN